MPTNVRCFYLIVSLLLPGLMRAQSSTTTTRPAVRPPATRPAETPAPSNTQSINSAANRQQELYDQYHGVTKKPVNPVTSSSPDQAESRPVATKSRADESSSSGVRIGIRGGGTLPVYLEKLPGVDPAPGFVGGLSFTFGAGTVSFQPEVNYMRIGAKASAGTVQATATADYIQVPLLLKFSSGTYDGTRFFVNLGPYGSYLAGIGVNGRKISLSGADDRISFGATAGIGAALKAGPGHLTIELRGSYELGNNENGFNTDSRVIFSQATLGYIFPLGGR